MAPSGILSLSTSEIGVGAAAVLLSKYLIGRALQKLTLTGNFPPALSEWASRVMLRTMATSTGFDRRLAGFTLTDIKRLSNADGTLIRGSVPFTHLLQGKEGGIDVGAIALLVDSLTTLAIVAHGTLPGVSVELNFEMFSDGFAAIQGAAAAESSRTGPLELEVEARVTKTGRMLAFTEITIWANLPSQKDSTVSSSERLIVAVGSHIKFVGSMPAVAKAAFAFGNLAPTVCLWVGKKLIKTPANLTVTVPSSAAVTSTLGADVEDAFLSDDDMAPGMFRVRLSKAMGNPYGAAHGAAIAAIMAKAALRAVPAGGQHLARSVAVTFCSPVRTGGAESELVTQVHERGTDSFVVVIEIRRPAQSNASKTSRLSVLARGRVTVSRL
eukprot:TRINITY_DN51250_c0_g1_i1.p1 TRINITY_DN51250_c0_g1~~TRINITY_DN51250_c0_g1_i1.p1  ORF type:complete len:407 (-),score=65.78 TRINITY_DN51250_c0_g1_i1:142-1293(-)